MHTGRVGFGAMDEVVFGRPASEVIVEQMDRLGANRAFLMVSGTLNRETDVIENIRRALGPRCVATFDAMPIPNQITKSGARMMRGTAFRTVITGSRISPTSGSSAALTPRIAPKYAHSGQTGSLS